MTRRVTVVFATLFAALILASPVVLIHVGGVLL